VEKRTIEKSRPVYMGLHSAYSFEPDKETLAEMKEIVSCPQKEQ